jgi:hypothetical protein
MNYRGLITTHDAEGAIGKYRIAKFGAADGGVAQATAATEALMGVNVDVPAAEAGDRVDICRNGITPVEYGDDVAAGALLTADSDGKAVPAAKPAAGALVRTIGTAEVAGADGDIGSIDVRPGVIYGDDE